MCCRSGPLPKEYYIESAQRHIQVTCAIIERDGLVLAAQRSATMNLPFKWEFPGGKVDAGETLQQCIQREIQEELGLDIIVGTPLPSSTHSYPALDVTLHPFICSITSGEIVLHEHAAVAWLPPSDLPQLDWAEADVPILHSYLSHTQTA